MPLLPKIYNSVIAKIKPLKILTNWAIRSILPKTIHIREGDLTLNKEDPAMSGLLAFGQFEPFMTETFRQSIKPGMTTVDIGANIGYYTLIASSHVGPQGKVISYEPGEKSHHLLCINIKSNNLQNSTVIKSAVSDKNGKTDFYLNDDRDDLYSMIANRPDSQVTTVSSTTLDNSLHSIGVTKVDIIKMDIEGAEILALAGATNTINNNPQLIIFSEFYPKAIKRLGRDPLDLLKICEKLNLSVSVIDEKKRQVVPLPPKDFQSFVAEFPDDESVKNLYITK